MIQFATEVSGADKVHDQFNNFTTLRLNDIKLQEMYQWAVNFYKMVTASIEDSITLVYEEQLYLLKVKTCLGVFLGVSRTPTFKKFVLSSNELMANAEES